MYFEKSAKNLEFYDKQSHAFLFNISSTTYDDFTKINLNSYNLSFSNQYQKHIRVFCVSYV